MFPMMNSCYSMRKADPSLMILALLVLLFEAFAVPVNAQTNGDEPVIPPMEPLSKIVFVNDLPPGETVTFEFLRGAKVYAAASKDTDAMLYEAKIHISVPDVDGITARPMTEASEKEWDPESGRKNAVFSENYNRISVRNENMDRASLKNPGILYFVLDANSDDKIVEKHYSTVYHITKESKVIYTKSDHIGNEYVTILNPSGATKVSSIRHIDGFTALSVSAGGVEETGNNDFTIHNIGKDDALTNAPLFFVDPVLTFHKQLSLFPSEFEFTARSVDTPSGVTQIRMDWKDWAVGMSPNYMLRNQTESFTYVFNATQSESQFEVKMFGDIGKSSKLTLSYDGFEGAGSETLLQRHLSWESRTTRGKVLTVDYQRGTEDRTRGVLVRVHCSQPSALQLLYISFCVVFFRMTFL